MPNARYKLLHYFLAVLRKPSIFNLVVYKVLPTTIKQLVSRLQSL